MSEWTRLEYVGIAPARFSGLGDVSPGDVRDVTPDAALRLLSAGWRRVPAAGSASVVSADRALTGPATHRRLETLPTAQD